MNTQEIEQMRSETQAYFDKVHKNMINMIRANNNNDTNKIHLCQQKEKELMQEICTSSVADIFQNLLIAEYKELVYESIYFPHFDRLDMLQTCELKRMILNYYGQEILDNHMHDPLHPMFNDDKHFYMFYEMVEKHGKTIFNHSIADDYDYEEYDGDQ